MANPNQPRVWCRSACTLLHKTANEVLLSIRVRVMVKLTLTPSLTLTLRALLHQTHQPRALDACSFSHWYRQFGGIIGRNDPGTSTSATQASSTFVSFTFRYLGQPMLFDPGHVLGDVALHAKWLRSSIGDWNLECLNHRSVILTFPITITDPA